MKNKTTIILVVLMVVIVVVALVVYFISKTKNAPVTVTQSKTQTGLANLLASGGSLLGTGGIGSLMGLFGGGSTTPTGNTSNSPVTALPNLVASPNLV